MNRLLKPNVIVNLIISIFLGIGLFVLGDTKDAPGICFIGIIVFILLMMRTLCNANIIKYNYYTPIVLLLLGSLITLLTIVLILDSEIQVLSIFTFMGLITGILLVIIGIASINKIKAVKS